jgi:DNA polymerase III delta subunit
MIYLLWGKDFLGSRKKLRELVDFFRAKTNDLGVFRVESDDFEQARFEELIKGQTLFGGKYVVVCNKILENSPASAFVEKKIEKIAESQNVFLFVEEEMDKDLLALFGQHGKKIQEFKQGRTLAEKGLNFGKFNPFAIGDALANKNKARTWILFQQALLNGVSAEEIFYKIVWQIKMLLLAKKNATNGLNPFVAKKNLAAAKNFTEQDLEDCSFSLLKIYHDCRRGLEEFETGLEKFLVK